MDQNVGTLKLVVLVSVPVIRLSFWFHEDDAMYTLGRLPLLAFPRLPITNGTPCVTWKALLSCYYYGWPEAPTKYIQSSQKALLR